MDQKQQEVTNWLNSGRDYQQGLMLLARYCKNKVIIHTLMKPGKEKFGGQAKLEYELTKAVGINIKTGEVSPSLPARQAGTPLRITETQQPATRTMQPVTDDYDIHLPLISNTPAHAYPKAIRRLKFEYGELYNKRSVQHRVMREVSPENSKENMEKRAALLAEIKSISKRMDLLYAHEEKWVRLGTIPDEAELWPEESAKIPAELPDDIDGLKKLKKNLQTNNVKDRNLLEYQSRTKGDEAHPMPDGPKRKLIEKQITDRAELIEKVELKLQELYLKGENT